MRLWLMASSDFGRIAVPLQLVELLLAPSVHEVLYLRSTCGPYSLGCTASCAFSLWSPRSASSMAAPLHYSSLPATLLLDSFGPFGQFIVPLHLAAPFLEPSVDGSSGLVFLWGRYFIMLPFKLH